MRNLAGPDITHPVLGNRYLAYTEPRRTARGLSDRRACLAALFAEAEISNRIPIIPYFHLDAKFNNNIEVGPNNLLAYLSLNKFDSILSGYITHDDFFYNNVSSKLVVYGKKASVRAGMIEQLVERQWPDGRWWKGLPDTKKRLDQFHGQLRGYRGWFRPPCRVYELAQKIANIIGDDYFGMHVRRGDRLALNRHLDRETQSEKILQRIVPYMGSIRKIYIATDERNPRHFDLLRKHYQVFTSLDFQCLDTANLKEDGFMQYAIEMCVVDLATISAFTFTNSGHWYDLEKDAPKFNLTEYRMDYLDRRVRWLQKIRKLKSLILKPIRPILIRQSHRNISG